MACEKLLSMRFLRIGNSHIALELLKNQAYESELAFSAGDMWNLDYKANTILTVRDIWTQSSTDMP